jgi:hypothetical protein
MFKQTIVDLADRHTTLVQWDKKLSGNLAMDLGDWGVLLDLHEQLKQKYKIDYSSFVKNGNGKILKKMYPAYTANKYWKYILQSDGTIHLPTVLANYALPLRASILPRVECDPGGAFPWKVSPVPNVLLYPYGWSTWLSVLITGDHDLVSLASFITAMFEEKVFRMSPGGKAMRLTEVFETISAGVRADAFAGPNTADQSSPDALLVATVLEKSAGILPKLGLTQEQKAALGRIVRPEGPPDNAAFESHLDDMAGGDPNLNFIYADQLGRFLWSQRLLKPIGRNQKDLRCYHDNTFRCLNQAWSHLGLIDLYMSTGDKDNARLKSWVKKSIESLRNPTYKNKSLKRFLQEGQVTSILGKKEVAELVDG